MSVQDSSKCGTCYGEGSVFNDAGTQSCPDCRGTGTTPGRPVLVEHRLRDIEASFRGGGQPSEPDIRWLVFEVRRAREALLQILSRTQDAEEADRIALDVKYVANEALGFYEPSPGPR
jgi:hypothetical protein